MRDEPAAMGPPAVPCTGRPCLVEVGGVQISLLLARDQGEVASLTGRWGAARDPGLVMSKRELEILSGLTRTPRRRDWMAGRIVMKALVLSVLQEPGLGPERVEVLPESSRAPRVWIRGDGGVRPLDAGVSLSHREGGAVSALVPGGAERV